MLGERDLRFRGRVGRLGVESGTPVPAGTVPTVARVSLRRGAALSGFGHRSRLDVRHPLKAPNEMKVGIATPQIQALRKRNLVVTQTRLATTSQSARRQARRPELDYLCDNAPREALPASERHTPQTVLVTDKLLSRPRIP